MNFRSNIFGYDFFSGDSRHLLHLLFAQESRKNQSITLAFLNPHSIIEAQKNHSFQKALSEFSLLLPDGTGIVLASKILGKDIKSRICGPDVFEQVIVHGKKEGKLRFFFMGSTDDVLNKIKTKLFLEEPAIEVVGTYSPPFGDFSNWDNIKICDEIVRTKPDILWVGLTAPKQELWISENKKYLSKVPIIAGIGAAFDFYAGTIKRSHPIFNRMGLEWLPRLIQEPKRLWRRNFVSTPLFLLLVVKEFYKQRREQI